MGKLKNFPCFYLRIPPSFNLKLVVISCLRAPMQARAGPLIGPTRCALWKEPRGAGICGAYHLVSSAPWLKIPELNGGFMKGKSLITDFYGPFSVASHV